MPADSPKTLNCPACGAPLDFDGSSAVVRCKFCRNISFFPGALPERAAAPSLVLGEIRRLIESGNLLEAIRQYRELFDVGLKEAREAVEALQAGRLVAPAAGAASAPPLAVQTSGLQEIQQLLAGGNKIAAIKRYREIYDVSLARAKYAVEQIEAGRTTWPEAGFPQPVSPSPQARPVKTGARAGCALVVAALLVLGGALVFVLFQPKSVFVPRLYVGGPAILVPSEAGTAPDVAVILYDPGAEARRLGLVDGESGQLRWQADPLPGGGYGDALAADDDLVYVANKTDLLAYRRDDGSLAWQACMSDRLAYGEETLLAVEQRVLTLNLDRTLQAYDTRSGELAWNRRLAGYDQTLRMLGGSLVLLDHADEEYTYSLIFLDPSDGRQQQVMTPSCEYSRYSMATVNPSSGLVYDEAGEALYLVYDSSPGCVQRLDLSSGQVSWEALADGSLRFPPFDFFGLATGSGFYFGSGDSGSGNRLLEVDGAAEALRTLWRGEDYELLPLTVMDDRLIARARRTRGSERFELWGLEIPSGEPAWQIDLGEGGPVDPPDAMTGLVDGDESAWTWSLVAGRLILVEFRADPHLLVLDSIDPADGLRSRRGTVALRNVTGSFYSVPKVIGWQGSLVYLTLSARLYALDAASGELVFER